MLISRLLTVLFVLLLVPSLAQVDLPGREEAMAEAENKMRSDPAAAMALFETITTDGNGQPIVDSLSGVAYHKLGVMAARERNFALAADHYRKAINVRDSFFQRPHLERAHSRSNLSLCLLYDQQPKIALQSAREATAIYDVLPQPDTIRWINSLLAIAHTSVKLRDLQLAYSATYRAIDLTERIDQSEGQVYQVYYYAAEVFLQFGELKEALKYAHLSLKQAEKLRDPGRVINAYNQLALTEHELGDREAERDHLLAAIAAFKLSEQAPTVLAKLYLNLSDYYGNRLDYDNSVRYDRLAKQLFTQADDLKTYNLYARHPLHLFAMDHRDEALGVVDEKIAFFTTDLVAADLIKWAHDNSAQVIPCIDLLTARAEILASAGRREEALKDYVTAMDLQDYLRTEVSSFDSRSYLSKNLRPLFDKVVLLYYNRYREGGDTEDLWRAFETSERARAFDLLTEMQTKGSFRTQAITGLDVEIAQLERRLARGESNIKKELATARLRMDHLLLQEGRSAESAVTLDRDQLITYLADQEHTLIEYYLSEGVGLVFTLRPTGELSVNEITDLANLNARISRWRTAIEEGRYRRKSLRARAAQDSLDKVFMSEGIALARQLLQVLDSLHPRPRLLIVPDGALHYLPFAALPVSNVEGPLDYGKVAYLQDRVELSHAYSAAVLLEVATQPVRVYAEKMVAFAPEFTVGNGSGLAPLVHNTREVNGLQKLLPRTVTYVGANATRTSFDRELGRAAILHLSSHGRVDPSDAALSFVAFSQLGDSLDRNELLYFNDLRHLPINNELTVLSACETTVGELAIGETTLSFGSALAAAGSRTTVTTLWEVDDGATKDLLLSFYRRLFGGTSLACSLNEARGELRNRRDYAHPYYWSGVVLYGNPAALPEAVLATDQRGDNYILTLTILLLSGLGTGSLLLLRWRKGQITV